MEGFPIPNTARGLSGKQSLQITQGHATAHSGLGQAYHRLGNDEQAIAEYNQAIKIYPDLIPTPSSAGVIAACRSVSPIGPSDDYNEAIRLGPNYSWCYASRGKVLEAKGDWSGPRPITTGPSSSIPISPTPFVFARHCCLAAA